MISVSSPGLRPRAYPELGSDVWTLQTEVCLPSTHTQSTPEGVSSDEGDGAKAPSLAQNAFQQRQNNSKPMVHHSNHNLDPLKEENKHLNIASLF